MTELTYDPGEHDLDVRVIEAVAAVTAVSETRIEPPLHRVVDPDALRKLFRNDTAGKIDFEYTGCRISIQVPETGPGSIRVTPL